jgi:hypothetical protein
MKSMLNTMETTLARAFRFIRIFLSILSTSIRHWRTSSSHLRNIINFRNIARIIILKLATTLGHETSHAIDNQNPSIDTNPQNNASKADNEIYAQHYGDDFSEGFQIY